MLIQKKICNGSVQNKEERHLKKTNYLLCSQFERNAMFDYFGHKNKIVMTNLYTKIFYIYLMYAFILLPFRLNYILLFVLLNTNALSGLSHYEGPSKEPTT